MWLSDDSEKEVLFATDIQTQAIEGSRCQALVSAVDVETLRFEMGALWTRQQLSLCQYATVDQELRTQMAPSSCLLAWYVFFDAFPVV